MIEQKVVENIIETANSQIVDIISDYVSLKRRGVNYIGCCPFHNEKTGSFTVSPAKGLFKCFGCGKAGNAVKFIMEHDRLSFTEAIKLLGDKVGIKVKEEKMTPEQAQAVSDRESMAAVTEFAKKQFIDNLWNTKDGISVGLPYFRSERGFRDDIIKKFELGYSLPQRDALTSLALQHGYKLEFLAKTGLTIVGENNYKSDRFFGRVMFPIHNVSGRVIAFGGRVLVKSDKVAKYQNSIECELYHKSEIVYGIFHAKEEILRKDRCYLVEGYTDVISMHQAGITNVIASSGTSLTTGQIKLIQRFTKNVTVLYDGDGAGIHAALRGIDMILAEGMSVKVLLLPDGEDPDSFARSHSADEYVAYIEEHQTDFIQFKTDLLLQDAKGDPLKMSALINDIVKTISVIPDIALRSVYIKDCHKRLGIDEETLFKVLEQNLVQSAKSKADDLERTRIQQQNREMRARAEGSQDLDPVAAGKDPVAVIQPIGHDDIIAHRNNPLVFEERELMRFFVTYVDKLMFVGTQEQTTVGEYVVKNLAADSIQSVDPVINKLIQAYIEAPEGSVNKDFFINQVDSDISTFAADILEPKYRLSKYHGRFNNVIDEKDQLDELVVRAMNEVRIKKLSIMVDKKKNELIEAEQNNASDEVIDEILIQIVNYQEAIKRISKLIGNRIKV